MQDENICFLISMVGIFLSTLALYIGLFKMPDNYDDICEEVMRHIRAHTVLLIVFKDSESGFTVTSTSLNPEIDEKIPEILRFLADKIENSPNPPMKVRPLSRG